MALVHSRVRRVVYALKDPAVGALGSCISLHQLKPLNHHYEVKGVFVAG
jgi:tRNA-specific adenosine deaminase 3